MIDYKPTLKKQLEKTGLPVYYELFVDSSTPTPCITYMEKNNVAELEGIFQNTHLLYSTLSFSVKVWGNSLSALTPYINQIDNIMRELGFKRTSYNELSYNTQLQLILSYVATGYENND